LQLDDLNNDGTPEVIFIKQYCTGRDKTSISYFGVADINGNTIWSHGEPKENLFPIHSDIAFNLGDIDGDGNKEMIMTQDFLLKVFDAATGELKNEIPTPGNECEKHIIGDSILLADLEGKGAKQNIILKDRYQNIWAYDNNLNLLWTRRLNTGHYPRAADINGDGREEIMAGYSMLTADGETMWTVPGADPYRNVWREPPHSEHADSIWIGRFSEGKDAPIQVAIAASDMGFLLLDANSGELISQDKCGHAQSLAIGKFRKELPGYQFAVSNLWGNSGILTLFDSKGNRLTCKEYPPFEVIVPVNWRGEGEANFLGITTRRMYDRDLEPVFRFPKKNKLLKTSVRPLADDFLGLGIDQLAFLNGSNIEIFKPKKHGNIKMKHNTENFNFYGAFFLEYTTRENA
jgi:rhamnogalacturonan endolyase